MRTYMYYLHVLLVLLLSNILCINVMNIHMSCYILGIYLGIPIYALTFMMYLYIHIYSSIHRKVVVVVTVAVPVPVVVVLSVALAL